MQNCFSMALHATEKFTIKNGSRGLRAVVLLPCCFVCVLLLCCAAPATIIAARLVRYLDHVNPEGFDHKPASYRRPLIPLTNYAISFFPATVEWETSVLCWLSCGCRCKTALSFFDGRKVTTRRAEIGIISPFLGLRPGR